jgi:hypothetical protein
MAGNVTCVGERRNVYRVIWGNLKGRNYMENLGVGGRVVLKCV